MSNEVEKIIAGIHKTFQGSKRLGVLATAVWNTELEVLMKAAERSVELERALVDVAASLAAAISLLERGGKAAKKAAPSDRMFDQMVIDYSASLERARAALTPAQPAAPDPRDVRIAELERALAEENEACAKLAETALVKPYGSQGKTVGMVRTCIAAAIRARSPFAASAQPSTTRASNNKPICPICKGYSKFDECSCHYE